MIAQRSYSIVTATSILAKSFGTAFGVGIPPVATYDSTAGHLYQWQLLEEAKLVIFTGGDDINPAIYGQKNVCSGFDSERDTSEIEVLRRAIRMNKKILGVCRGHQLINAYFGGTLVQDLSMYLNTNHDAEHVLEVVDESGVIPNLFQGEVNSIHHQGVVKAGEGLTPTTYWKGVYESTEAKDILTVQFHPEWMDIANSNLMNLSLWNYIATWAHLNTGDLV